MPSVAAAQPPQHTDRTPFDFVACQHCYTSISSAQLWLTTCAHALCSACAFPPPISPPDPPTASEATCPIDGVRGAVIPLDEALKSDAAHFFRPLSGLLSDAGMAAEWQMSNLVGQLEHYKAKSLEQRKALSKVAVELKALRGMKGCVSVFLHFPRLADSPSDRQVEKLTTENASLRSQLASFVAHPGPSYAPQGQQHQQHVYDEPSAAIRVPGTGQKRKARKSPDRFAALSCFLFFLHLFIERCAKPQAPQELPSATANSCRLHCLHRYKPRFFSNPATRSAGSSSRTESSFLHAGTSEYAEGTSAAELEAGPDEQPVGKRR
jgi:hypothetical protein